MSENLADHIRSYLEDDEVVYNPSDPESETRTNTWTYSVAGSDPSANADVVLALRDVAENLRLRLQTSEVRGKFYAWYDGQAGQLRCSLTSRETLPFGATVQAVSDPAEIVGMALADPTPGMVEWSELEDVLEDDTDEPDPMVVVWVAPV